MKTNQRDNRSSELNRGRFRRKLKDQWELYVASLIPLTLLAIFNYTPMAYVTMAFQKYSIKKGLFRSMSGRVYDKTLEIRVGFESYVFDIFVGGRKLCQIQQGSNGVCDCDTIRMYDGTMEEIAVALAVICDRASDKADSERYGN